MSHLSIWQPILIRLSICLSFTSPSSAFSGLPDTFTLLPAQSGNGNICQSPLPGPDQPHLHTNLDPK